MKNLLILYLILLIPVLGYTQYSIRGKIENQQGEALAGAHIVLKETFKSAISNSDGSFILKNLNEGTYVIRISYLGYETIEKNIRIDKDISIEISLQRKAYLEDEVIITATRAEKGTPATYENVNEKQIEEINFAQDLPYLIQTTPSLVVSSDAGAGVGYSALRIRGTDITRINVTVNGIPLNDPESQGVFWVNMPDFASSVSNLQVQRGVGTSANGAAAFGASINIQSTDLNQNPYARIRSISGSFNTWKNNVEFGSGLISGKWSFDGRLSKISSDGYVDRAFSDLKSFYLSGGYFGKTSMIKFVTFSGKERTYQSWYGIPKDSLATNRTYNPYTYENETDNYWQDHYQLHFTQKINNKLYLNTSLFYIRGKGYYEQYKDNQNFSDYQLPGIHIGDTTISSTDLIRQKWLDNHFYGFTYSLKYNSELSNITIGGSWNKYDGDHFGEVIWAKYASNMDNVYCWYDNKGIKKDFNIYGKLNQRLNERLSLYGDLQFRLVDYEIDGIHDDLRDISQFHAFTFFNPKAGLFYTIDNDHSIYFSFAVANREPNRSNYRDADESNQPQPERLFDYELGYDLNRPGAGLQVNFYFMDYKDQLVMTGEINNVGAAIMTNVSDSYRAGIEILSNLKVSDLISWSANFSLSQNKIKNFTGYIDDWDNGGQISKDLGETDLAFSPGIVGGSQIVYTPLKGLKINLISKYVGRQYIDNSSSKLRSLDPYFVNDVVINYSFKTKLIKEVGLHLMLNNIFNEEYETYAWVYRYFYSGEYHVMDGYFPQAGFNLLGGISLEF